MAPFEKNPKIEIGSQVYLKAGVEPVLKVGRKSCRKLTFFVGLQNHF